MNMQIKVPNLSSSRVLALAGRAFIEILRGILSLDNPYFKHYVITGGANPCDGPPLEEGPNPYSIELRDSTPKNFPGDSLGVGSHVIIGWERDPAAVAKVDREVAGGLIDSEI